MFVMIQFRESQQMKYILYLVTFLITFATYFAHASYINAYVSQDSLELLDPMLKNAEKELEKRVNCSKYCSIQKKFDLHMTLKPVSINRINIRKNTGLHKKIEGKVKAALCKVIKVLDGVKFVIKSVNPTFGKWIVLELEPEQSAKIKSILQQGPHLSLVKCTTKKLDQVNKNAFCKSVIGGKVDPESSVINKTITFDKVAIFDVNQNPVATMTLEQCKKRK